jgi:hypothetical protein
MYSRWLIIDLLKFRIAIRTIRIAREEYAVSHNGMKLFGVLDLASELVPGMSKSLGFRHANDKSLSIQIVAGRVLLRQFDSKRRPDSFKGIEYLWSPPR